MSLDPKSVPRQNLGSWQSCLVEGDPEECARERRVRRRALVTSVILQASVLAALILVPLFAKPARLVMAIATPVPPYRHVDPQTHSTERPRTEVRHICVTCFNSRPARLDANSRAEATNPEEPNQDIGAGVPAVPCPSCINLPSAGPQAPIVGEPRRQKAQLVHTHIDPAMLVRRVEPVYPMLAKQLGRAGRVELRAIIATDGTIQSLQVVSGDPLFYHSALDAVREWRYKPTVLNGEAVEIDTFITVIYNINR
jgi:periplasmic protein TonB